MSILKIKVLPGSKRNEISGFWQDMLKIKVTAQPEDGKANRACINLISDKLNIPKNKISLIKGHKSREKQINIEGVSSSSIDSKIKQIFV